MSKTLNISDEERALLTEEEIAGMMEGEEFDEDQDENGNQDDGGSDDAGQAGDAGDQGGNDGADDQGDQGGSDDGEAAAGRDDGAPADHAAPVSFDTVLPDDFDERVAKIGTDKEALITQFDEGDITSQEYHKQLDALNKQERDLERLADRAEYDLRQRRQTWVNVHVKGFLDQHPEYRAPALNVALDMEVRRLQASGNYDSETDPKILSDAHDLIAAQIPGAFAQQQAKPAGQGNKPAAPAKKPTVPTLANVPAANIDQPGAGEFDMLDRLQSSDPLRYQDELEKLARTNPAKYDEYLAS